MSIFNSKEDERRARQGEDIKIETDKPAETVVGPSVTIEGDFVSKDDMKVEGRVKGSVKTGKNVFVGEGAEIEAEVKAENAIISGRVSGNINIKGKLELTPTARVFGDIKCRVLSIAPGAIFSGNSQMEDEGAPDKAKEKDKKKKKEKDETEELASLVGAKK